MPMELAVCGLGGNPNCYGDNTLGGGRKTARRSRRSRRSRRGGARRSRRRGVRGGRQSNMAYRQMPQPVNMLRGGGNASEFLPAVCGEGGWDC